MRLICSLLYNRQREQAKGSFGAGNPDITQRRITAMGNNKPDGAGNDDGKRLTGKDARERFKPLTEETVQALTDAGSFSNGRQYYQSGYIVDAVLRGDTLRAKSLGRSGGPYTIEVELTSAEGAGKEGPLSGWACSCPRGGFCKHVGAA